MFEYKNSLCDFNDDNYPYSIEYIKESRYEHNHGVCDKEGFAVTKGGGKHLFVTPELKSLSFKVKVDISKAYYDIFNMHFGILLGFTKKGKQGNRLDFVYDGKSLSVRLLKLSGIKIDEITRKEFENVYIKDETSVLLNITVEENKITGTFDECGFEFCVEIPRGRVGIAPAALYRKIVFTDAEIISGEKSEKEKIYSLNKELPPVCGGRIPYSIDIDIYSYGNSVYEMQCRLNGGIAARKEENQYSDVWVNHFDDIADFYIKIINDKKCSKYYLFNGKSRFLDINAEPTSHAIFDDIHNTKKTPFEKIFGLMQFEDDALIGIGCGDFTSFGYEPEAGAFEHIYNKNGELVYSGKPLEEATVAVIESPDKKIIADIPKNICDYEKAVEHARVNHYFYCEEGPKFKLSAYTVLNSEYMSFKVKLLDAFYNYIEDVEVTSVTQDDSFSINGYSRVGCDFKLPSQKCGVYHIEADICYGDKTVCSHRTAFEVIDKNSDISPQEAAGLPTMYVGDAAPALCMSSTPDFYSVHPEYDWGHYCSTALYVPIASEERRVWEILRFYKRKLFTWFTVRTVDGYDLKNLQGTIENSDYINYIYPKIQDCRALYYRCDLYSPVIYESAFVINLLYEFLEKNQQYKNSLGIDDVRKGITEEDVMKLLRICGDEWICFGNRNMKEQFKLQKMEELSKHSWQKRCSYGPIPIYFTENKAAYSIKWYGFDPATLHEVFDGFLQYEDYPLSASYQTYVCAWSVLTIKLMCPQVKVYPELYYSFPDGCPDGAVSGARPPLGGSYCPPYFTMTQMCEYLYNTPRFADGGFCYWDDYGFVPFSFMDLPAKRAECILKLWGKFLENKPASPEKTTAFLYEINSDGDRYDYDICGNHFYNISESNMAYTYGVMRSSGLPGGFGVFAKDLEKLTAEDINCLVLPDMSKATEETLRYVRKLHADGITLVALGKVSGLEDIFGVRENPQTVKAETLVYGDETENITPVRAEFTYEVTDGKPVLYANGMLPAIITNGNCVLLNTPISQTGIDDLPPELHMTYHGRPNISILMRKALADTIEMNVKATVKASENTGVTLLKTEKGDALLLISDYSRHNESDGARCKEITFNTDIFTDAQYINICNDDLQYCKLRENGVLKGISVMLRPQETLMFKLQ